LCWPEDAGRSVGFDMGPARRVFKRPGAAVRGGAGDPLRDVRDARAPPTHGKLARNTVDFKDDE